jgi:nucleotide-binding universal stress UspA family protein
MDKKIVIAIDSSQPSKRALDYVVQVSTRIPDLQFVLLHIQPMVSLYLKEESRTSVFAKKKMENISNENKRLAHALLDGYRRDMMGRGIDAQRIESVTQARKLGYAKDIIEYAQKGRFDALVLGRRGLSGITKLYAGSVTANILEQSQVIPVWLVDGEVSAGKILAAVDGSEASLRVVDHLSFMMSGDSRMRVTLLHVAGNARNYCEIDLQEQPDAELEEIIVRGDKACIDQFYARVLEKFNQAGIDKERVRFETIKSRKRIGKAVMDFAKKGDYRTLVIGRRGMDKSFFMGSVSRYMINTLSDSALWVIP